MTFAWQAKSCNLIGPSQIVLAMPRKSTKVTRPPFRRVGGAVWERDYCFHDHMWPFSLYRYTTLPVYYGFPYFVASVQLHQVTMNDW